MLYSTNDAILFLISILALIILAIAVVTYCKTLLKEIPPEGNFTEAFKEEFISTAKSFLKAFKIELYPSTADSNDWAINNELAENLRDDLANYDARPQDAIGYRKCTFSSFKIPCVEMDFCPSQTSNGTAGFQVEKSVLKSTFENHLIYCAVPFNGIHVGIKKIRSGYYAVRILYALTPDDAESIQHYFKHLRNSAIAKAIASSVQITDSTLEQDIAAGTVTKSNSTSIILGRNLQYGTDIHADIMQTGHICIVGGTGSGKSMLILYLLYNISRLQMPIQLYIGDFKKSGDYTGISTHFAEFDKVVELIDDFYNIFENTPEENSTIQILLIDEYAGFIVWLTQKDKKKAEEAKGKIANILMMGRSKKCYIWCIQQRISAQLFPSGIGAIDNFQICIGMGRLTVDSRKSLFAGEHTEDEDFEKKYRPNTGKGLCLIDGQPLMAIGVPEIKDKEALKWLLSGCFQ